MNSVRAKVVIGCFIALTLLSNTASGQEEKTKSVHPMSSAAFFAENSTKLPHQDGFYIYDLMFKGGHLAADERQFVLGGTSIRNIDCKNTWIIGPVNYDELVQAIEVNRARILDLEKITEFMLPGEPSYFAVLTSNTGVHLRGGGGAWNMTAAGARDWLRTINMQPIDLMVTSQDEHGNRYTVIALQNEVEYIMEFMKTSTEIKTLMAENPGYRAIHLGWDGGGSPQGGDLWNIILERANGNNLSTVLFGKSESEIRSAAADTKHRIALLTYDRLNSEYAAILVPVMVIEWEPVP